MLTNAFVCWRLPVGAFAEEWGKALAAAGGFVTTDITNA
jgi:hypothetical protein